MTKKAIFQAALLYATLVFAFVLLDLVIDWLILGNMLSIMHLVPALVAVLISTVLLQRVSIIRKRSEDSLRLAYDQMENRVRERTQELEAANRSLQAEISEREQAERERQDLLAETEFARQHAEELAGELQAANRMLNALIETLPAGMVIVDADGEIVMANPRVRDIMGKDLPSIASLQTQNRQLCRMDGTPFSAEGLPLNQAIQAGVSITGEEICIIREDNRKSYLWIGASPVRDETGAIVSAVEIVQDITELKRMEHAIRESEGTAMALINAFSESALLTDMHGVVLAVNEVAAKRLNLRASEMVGHSLFDFFSPEVALRRQVYLDKVLETKQSVQFEDERDGIYFDNSIFPVFDQDGTILRLAVFGEDVTQRKLAEQTLRASEQKFSTVFHHSPDVIAIARLKDGVLLDVNEAFSKLLGYPRAEVIGRDWSNLNLVSSKDELDVLIRLFYDKGSVADYELRFIAKDQSVAIALVSLISIIVSGEPCFLIIAHDITKRKHSEEALLKVQAELALDIQKRTAMEERQRLARELHDSVSQALYGISLGAHTALALFETDRPRVLEALNYILSLAQAGLTEMRALIFELRPESLEMEGLVVALTKQTAALSARHGINVALNLCSEPETSLRIKEVIYRIAQEALHNAVKHARPNRLEVHLICEDGRIQLVVSDNGIGFKPQANYPGHLGLRSMNERAARVGGKLEVISEPGRGAQIRADIPLDG